MEPGQWLTDKTLESRAARDRRLMEYRFLMRMRKVRWALYQFDAREQHALKVWLADNAWLLLGMTEEEWNERD